MNEQCQELVRSVTAHGVCLLLLVSIGLTHFRTGQGASLTDLRTLAQLVRGKMPRLQLAA